MNCYVGRTECYALESRKWHKHITVPAPNVTTCAFGEKIGTLFIITARAGMSQEQLRSFPASGGVFKVKPGVKGMKANFFRTKQTKRD